MNTSVLNNFGLGEFDAANRVQVGRLRGFGRLGVVSDISAESSVDIAIAVGETRVLTALSETLAKIDYKLYQKRLPAVAAALEMVAELNQQISSLTSDRVAAWRVELDNVNSDMAELEQQLQHDIEASRTKRDILAVTLTAGAMLLAGAGGWYVFKRRRK